jgi:hypothetical protein
MAIYTMLGMIIVVAVIAFGVYWLVTNVTFKSQPDRYIYKTDKNGAEFVEDTQDKT